MVPTTPGELHALGAGVGAGNDQVGPQLGVRSDPNPVLKGVKDSWAEVMSRSLPTSWNKNILEVILEKDSSGSFTVDDSDCSTVLKKIGLDPRPGVHAEGIQICPGGRGIILITLKEGVAADQFCGHDVWEVTRTGIRVSNIKPAGKREVVVHVKNLHPNTMDDTVVNYLNKFGKVVTNKVVYGIFGDGPLKGFRNGDRSYKMEIKPDKNIGTYHFLDGQKVNIRYQGQSQTCARCYETARTCKGKGLAKKCEEQNGIKMDFSKYILKLWEEIGYNPKNPGAIESLDDNHEKDPEYNIVEQEGGVFTPISKVVAVDTTKFEGVSLKTFPKEVQDSEIVELLVASGLPHACVHEIQVNPNGKVTVQNLENSICMKLINSLNRQVYFGRKIFCNGIIPLTPLKSGLATSATLSAGNSASATTSIVTATLPSDTSASTQSSPIASEQSQTCSETTAPSSLINHPLSETTTAPTQVYTSPLSSSSPASSYKSHPKLKTDQLLSSSSSIAPNQSLLDIGKCGDIQDFVDEHWDSNEKFVRRHSLSLRSPPLDSLAAEIIHSKSSVPVAVATSQLTLAQTLLGKGMKESTTGLTDFESCCSSEGELTNSEKETDNEEFKTMNEKKRGWKSKRKKSTTPDKDAFVKHQVKKINLNSNY